MSKKLSIAYFGTPDFSSLLLSKLHTNSTFTIQFVVTQPKKPIGRKQIITPSKVAQYAAKNNIEVFTPNNKEDLLNLIPQLKKIDIAFVFAYGLIIPKNLLTLPMYGFCNIHPSPLPHLKGASPTTYTLLLGEKTSRVCLIQMDELMDHGPIINQKSFSLHAISDKTQLHNLVAEIAYSMILNIVSKIATDYKYKPALKEQDHLLSTYTNRIKKDHGYISIVLIKKALLGKKFTKSNSSFLPTIVKEFLKKNPTYLHTYTTNNPTYALIIYHFFQGLTPWPGIWTKITNKNISKRLLITQCHIQDNQLIIDAVKLEGKKEISFKEFTKYHTLY